MDEPLTYGQCLRKVMDSNRLGVNTLSKKMGYRGNTQLMRILRDEVSSTLVTKFHQQFMLIFDWLISPADIRALSTALQYTCLGPDSFLTRRAMRAMMLEPTQSNLWDSMVTIYPTPPYIGVNRMPLRRALGLISGCRRLDLLVIGSAFDSLLPCISDLSNAPELSLHIRHTFILEDHPAKIIEQISALLPFLNMNTYEGTYFPESARQPCAFVREHQVLLARIEHADGRITTAILPPPQEGALHVCHLQGENALYAFYEARVDGFRDQQRPIKAVYPQPDTAQGLLLLCQRDLFLEQNHACCFVRLDLCFHALPTEQVLRAIDFSAMGLSPDDPLVQEFIHVHEERYHNLMNKKETTHFVLSLPAMRDFMRTGRLSDHLFAMRAFTPQERREILGTFLEGCRANPNLHVHVFADERTAPVACFSGYADIGVQISDNHTTYNITNNHGEVFIGLPAFADALRAYVADALISDICLDDEKSLARLTALLEEEPHA